MNFSREDLEFFAVIGSTPTGERLLMTLQKRLEQHNANCRNLDVPHVYRAQGAAGEIEEIISALKEARQRLQPIGRTQQQFGPVG